MNAAAPVGPGRVDIHCEDCAAHLGRSAPTLIVAARDGWGWELLSTGPRRPHARPGPLPIGGLVASNTTRKRDGRSVNQHHVRGRRILLACRLCKRGPVPRRRRGLVELAAAASAAGRGDAYLSLR